MVHSWFKAGMLKQKVFKVSRSLGVWAGTCFRGLTQCAVEHLHLVADQKTSLEEPKSPELTLQIAAVFDTSLIHRREGETHFIKKQKANMRLGHFGIKFSGGPLYLLSHSHPLNIFVLSYMWWGWFVVVSKYYSYWYVMIPLKEHHCVHRQPFVTL